MNLFQRAALLLLTILLLAGLLAACGAPPDSDAAADPPPSPAMPQETPSEPEVPEEPEEATPPEEPTSDVTAPTDSGETDFSILFLDVGQADSMLITCGDAHMLVDGGNVADSSLVASVL